jgi:hypothetical protein
MTQAKHSTTHWDGMSVLFDTFTDDELVEYFLAKLRAGSRQYRERSLMAITVLQAKVVETFRNQAKQFPPPNSHQSHHSNRPIDPQQSRRLRFILVTREAFTLVSTGGVVAHQFRISSADHPEQLHTVSIAGPQPACDCPEFIQKPGFCCQHILFVYVQVLKHPHAQQIYTQMSPSNKLHDKPDPAFPQCILCAGAVRPEHRSHQCETCSTHIICLEAWKRAIIRVYGNHSCPCKIDVTQTRNLHAEGGTLIATPVKIGFQ